MSPQLVNPYRFLPPVDISMVQKAPASSATTSVTATFGATPTHERLLVAFLTTTGSSDTTHSATEPGWAKATGIGRLLDAPTSLSAWWKIATPSEPTAQQFGDTGAGACHVVMFEYAGIVNANPLDQFEETDGGQAVRDALTLTAPPATTQAKELVIAGVGLSGGGGGWDNTWTNSFTQQDATSARLAVAHRIVDATGTYGTSEGWTTARVGLGIILTFKGAT